MFSHSPCWINQHCKAVGVSCGITDDILYKEKSAEGDGSRGLSGGSHTHVVAKRACCAPGEGCAGQRVRLPYVPGYNMKGAWPDGSMRTWERDVYTVPPMWSRSSWLEGHTHDLRPVETHTHDLHLRDEVCTLCTSWIRCAQIVQLTVKKIHLKPFSGVTRNIIPGSCWVQKGKESRFPTLYIFHTSTSLHYKITLVTSYFACCMQIIYSVHAGLTFTFTKVTF